MNTEKILTILLWAFVIGFCLVVSMVLGGLHTMNESVGKEVIGNSK